MIDPADIAVVTDMATFALTRSWQEYEHGDIASEDRLTETIATRMRDTISKVILPAATPSLIRALQSSAGRYATSEESKFGADFLVTLQVRTAKHQMCLGWIAQAKIRSKLRARSWRDLLEQCRSMERELPGNGWAVLYGRRTKVIRASLIAGLRFAGDSALLAFPKLGSAPSGVFSRGSSAMCALASRLRTGFVARRREEFGLPSVVLELFYGTRRTSMEWRSVQRTGLTSIPLCEKANTIPSGNEVMDWASVVDLRQAARNLHLEALGDSYRDPWAWPEIAWLTDHPDLVFQSLQSASTGRLSKIDVPKENFAVRPAVVLEPCDRMGYEALVDVTSESLIGDLRWWVYGWRLGRRNRRAGNYATNKGEWELYRNWLSWLASSHSVALVTDVVSYFASIPTETIAEDVERVGGGAVGRRIASMLRSWARTPGRSGIPQRSIASSVIANRYLMQLDEDLERLAGRASPGQRYSAAVRWMDDVWIFGHDRGELRRGQVSLQNSLRELGLNLGIRKNQGPRRGRTAGGVQVIEHSAVDAGLDESPADLEPLQDLVDRLVASPNTCA